MSAAYQRSAKERERDDLLASRAAIVVARWASLVERQDLADWEDENANRKPLDMAAYQLVAQLPGSTMQTVQRMADNAFIPFDPANRDYQEYLQWLEAGNEPDPAPSGVRIDPKTSEAQ